MHTLLYSGSFVTTMENQTEQATRQVPKQRLEVLLSSSLASVLECKTCRQRYGNLALLTQHEMNCKLDKLATLASKLLEIDAALAEASTESRFPKPTLVSDKERIPKPIESDQGRVPKTTLKSDQQQTTIHGKSKGREEMPGKKKKEKKEKKKEKKRTSGDVVATMRDVPTRKFHYGMSCKDCHEIFMTEACMTGHECDVESDTIVEETEEEIEEEIVEQQIERTIDNLGCQDCDSSCSERFMFKVHAKDHSAGKSYSCDKCDYRCHASDVLKAHLRIHSGEKAYACALCDFRSSQPEKLKSHMRVHRGEKTRAKRAKHARLLEIISGQDGGGRGVPDGQTHLCCLCSEKFGNSGELQLHVAIMHDKVYEQFVGVLQSHATVEGIGKCSPWEALVDVATVRYMDEQAG